MIRWLPVLTLAVLCGAGCGEAVLDPFQETDLAFSLFGVLDAGADTQYVRVTPVRRTLVVAPEPLAARVTLEEMATGETVTLRDSLFRFPAEREMRYGHNFWAARRLRPRMAYRVRVAGPSGEAVTAPIVLPDTFPTPRIRGSTIEMTGIDRLADVQVIYCIRDLVTFETLTHTVSYRDEVAAADDTLRVFVSRSRDEQAIGQVLAGRPRAILAVRVRVAAAGPDWPEVAGLDEETLALPQVVSNVSGGVGFVGGIAARTVRWPSSIPWPPVCPR